MTRLVLDPLLVCLDEDYAKITGGYASTETELFQFAKLNSRQYGTITYNAISSQWNSLIQNRQTSTNSSSSNNSGQVTWAWQGDDGQYVAYPPLVSKKLEIMRNGEKVDYQHLGKNFIIIKDTNTTATQYNPSTNKKRAVQRITTRQSRTNTIGTSTVVWQYQDDDGSYKDCESSLSQQLEQKIPGSYVFELSSNKYTLDKLDDNNAVQINQQTKKQRKLRRRAQGGQGSWLWQDDDGTYKPYDTSVSQAIENSNVGQSVDLGGYTAVKRDSSTGIQSNKKTGHQRVIKRQYDNRMTLATNSNTSSNSSSGDGQSSDADNLMVTLIFLALLAQMQEAEDEMNQITTTTESVVWEWQENDGSYKPYDDNVTKAIEGSRVGSRVSIDSVYEVVRKEYAKGIQVNKNTNKVRECRRRVVKNSSTTSTEYQNLQDKYEKLKSEMQVLQDAVWEWQDNDGSWKVYNDAQFIKKLDDARVGVAVPLVINGNQFTVTKSDDTTAVQKGVSTNRTRAVRKRATNKSSGDMGLPDWWISTNNLGPKSCFVKVWRVNDHPLAKQAVQEFSSTVSSATYDIMDIFVVQNVHTWYQHQSLENAWLSAKKITPQTRNIRWLWHGTSSKTVPEICSKGFLRDYNTTALHGKGVYFARDAKYPVHNGYARFDDPDGYAHLLYCRVICGESVQGKKDLVRPPSKNDGSEYETMVDSVTDPTIIVCCTDCQAYPVLKLVIKKKK